MGWASMLHTWNNMPIQHTRNDMRKVKKQDGCSDTERMVFSGSTEIAC